MIPHNLLGVALGVLPQQVVHWIRFRGMQLDDRGREMAMYWPEVTITGSLQAVDAEDVHELGLDMRREYIKFYSSAQIGGSERDGAPDFIVYGGVKYEVVGRLNWHLQNGWGGVVCVRT